MLNKLIILLIILLALLSKNRPMTYGGLFIFLLSFLNKEYLNRLDKGIFLTLGMTSLIIWMLIPLIQTSATINSFHLKSYLNLEGLVSFISGLMIVVIASKGSRFINDNVSSLLGITLGSIIGVTFLGGIPVGMLSGAGMAYLIVKLIKILIGDS